MRKHARHVSVWMNDAEYQHLREQARIAGLGIDPFIRNLVANVELRSRPPDTYAGLLRELSAIGNNMNQIARWANTRKNITEDETQAAIAMIHKVWHLVKEVV